VALVLNLVESHRMVLTTLYRSVLMRLLAALIIVLVVSPYSEPFATMYGTDFGGAGAVDLGGTSKLETSALAALVPPIVVVVEDVFVTVDWPILQTVTLHSRDAQRAVLRL
jgi:hypothetical protein